MSGDTVRAWTLLLLAACDPVPVAGDAIPCPGWEAQGDLVVDPRTALAWDGFVVQSFFTHEQAAEACAAKGARLPTRAELLALRTPSDTDACLLPACAFRGARCLTIQCGSAIPGSDGDHWGVAMSGGALVAVPAGQAEAMLCVRDAVPVPVAEP